MATAASPPAIDAPTPDATPAADPSHLARTLVLVRDLHVATASSNYRQIKRITAELAAAGREIVPEMLGAVPLVVPVAEVKRALGENPNGDRYELRVDEGKIVLYLHDALGADAAVVFTKEQMRVLVADALAVVAEVEQTAPSVSAATGEG